jgi:cytidine deaminase
MYFNAIIIPKWIPAQAQILKSIGQKNATRQCPCGACRETCHSKSDDDFHIKLVENPISIWEGLNVKLVSGFYGGFIVVIVFVKWTRG